MSDRSAAFERAAQARAAIERIVSTVASGDTDLDGAFTLGDGDPLMGRTFAVKVFEVLPGIGKVRARRTMADIGLPDDIWLRDVPADKRPEIAAAFAQPA